MFVLFDSALLVQNIITVCCYYLDSLLSSSGALTTRTNSLNQELSEYNIELEELDISIEKSRERYKKQYGAMESIVNSFKSTGEFLDNYMEAQNKD